MRTSMVSTYTTTTHASTIPTDINQQMLSFNNNLTPSLKTFPYYNTIQFYIFLPKPIIIYVTFNLRKGTQVSVYF